MMMVMVVMMRMMMMVINHLIHALVCVVFLVVAAAAATAVFVKGLVCDLSNSGPRLLNLGCPAVEYSDETLVLIWNLNRYGSKYLFSPFLVL